MTTLTSDFFIAFFQKNWSLFSFSWSEHGTSAGARGFRNLLHSYLSVKVPMLYTFLNLHFASGEVSHA